LRHLGELADTQITILVDSREQNPLPFNRLQTRVASLVSGDYSAAGLQDLFAIERKSVPDLVACCMAGNRARFERELCRLRGHRFARLLVVGSQEEILAGQYHSKINPKAVMASLYAFEARYIPVVFSPTPEAAGRLVERFAFWFAREIVESVNDLWRAAECRARRARRDVQPV